ncbi:MAG TPA: LptF/LptG family permease [Clostridiales bacterium]|nr:LptF/LptG family permease [Clostridiales bacterium]HQP70662.1 LptF/LptG family permease [Clostridiales bacterium]
MRIVSFYILKEHIFPFFMSLGMILFIFVLNIVMKMMTSFVGKGLDLLVILEFFYLSLGWILALAVPMSVLVASLMAYGRLSQDNEWSVMQSSGISIYQAMAPALIAGLFMSWGMLYFNNNILPEMNHQTKILKSSITKKKPLAVIEPGIFVTDIPGFVIKAETVDNVNNELFKIILLENSRSGKYRRTITAESGKLIYDQGIKRYRITLRNGEIANLDPQKPDGYFRSKFSKMELTKEVSGIDFEVEDKSYYGDREKSADSLKAKIFRLKRDKASALLISQVEVEYYKKYALSFACLIMVLIGAPLGLMSGRGGLGGSVTMSILIFLVYWFFLISGEDLADRGKLNPFFAMWNANIIIGILGLVLIRYASRGVKISFMWLNVLWSYISYPYKKLRK